MSVMRPRGHLPARVYWVRRTLVLVVALGLVLIEAGIWRVTQSLFPNERNFRPLRKETDYFITLVRRLNRAAVNVQRGSNSALEDLTQVHDEMHHSVDRMMRLAGLTDEDLGFRYSPKKELPEPQPQPAPVREQIAAQLLRHRGVTCDPDSEITVVPGATEGIYCAVTACVRPGDEVIVLDPCYDSYEPSIALAGGRAVHIPLTPHTFAVDWQRVEAAVSKRTRLIMVNSPHNPSGSTLSADDLLQLQALAERMKIPMERFMVNLDRFGNTSAAAVAIALDEANRTGRMKTGEYILLVVFGGGLTWASSVIQW